VIIVIRGTRWAKHETFMGKNKNIYIIKISFMKRRDHLEYLEVDG
jgi:hypothetical protein